MGKRKRTRVNRSVRNAGKRVKSVVTTTQSEAPSGRPTRPVDDHPLVLAHTRGKIDDEQFAAGKWLRDLCETLEKSGRDSTQLDGVRGGSSAQPWTDAQSHAAITLGILRDLLGGDRAPNWVICRAFCGDGWSMADAVRKANIPCSPHGILPRVQEALDALAGRERVVGVAKPKTVPVPLPSAKRAAQTICPGCNEKLCLGHPVKSRLCELVVCLGCYRIEAEDVREGRSPVARYRETLKEWREASKAISDAPKRVPRKKVARAA